MMEAWAAEAAAHHADEVFYHSAEFWVAIGFVILVGLIGRTAFRVVGVALDERAKRIRAQLDESERLATEAQQLLSTYERRQREAADEAATILENARREAARFAEHATEELARSLKRREQQAMDRISQAEAEAVAEIRTQVVDVTMEATRRLLAGSLPKARSDALIEEAIAQLPSRLH